MDTLLITNAEPVILPVGLVLETDAPYGVDVHINQNEAYTFNTDAAYALEVSRTPMNLTELADMLETHNNPNYNVAELTKLGVIVTIYPGEIQTQIDALKGLRLYTLCNIVPDKTTKDGQIEVQSAATDKTTTVNNAILGVLANGAKNEIPHALADVATKHNTDLETIQEQFLTQLPALLQNQYMFLGVEEN